MDYFLSVTMSATSDELCVLDVLCKAESIQGYSSQSKEYIKEETNLSDAQLRKVLSSLERIQFITRVCSNRKHSYFISPYGLQAINQITEEESI